MIDYQNELDTGLAAVIQACRLCTDVQSTLKERDSVTKDDRSPVTIADFGSQAVIISELSKSFPGDGIVAEEDSSILRSNPNLQEAVDLQVKKQNQSITRSEMLELIDYGKKSVDFGGRYWTLDPIDGTKGFLRGDQYAVALALVDHGVVQVGILGCPNLPWNIHDPQSSRGFIAFAVKGKGTFATDMDHTKKESITVDDNLNAEDALFCESIAHADSDLHARIASKMGITRDPLRIDSQAKYAVVARGDASIYLRISPRKSYRHKIWDHAAGSILVEEAGGKVTDLHGRALDFSFGEYLSENPGIVATNGHLHQSMIDAIAKTLNGSA